MLVCIVWSDDEMVGYAGVLLRHLLVWQPCAAATP
jgi:hypothetical protein